MDIAVNDRAGILAALAHVQVDHCSRLGDLGSMNDACEWLRSMAGLVEPEPGTTGQD